MPQERLPKQALLAKANGKIPVWRPRTKWTNYIEDIGWNQMGFHQIEMMDVMEDREVWRLNLEMLFPQPSRKSGQRRITLKFRLIAPGGNTAFEKMLQRCRAVGNTVFDLTKLVTRFGVLQRVY